MSVIRKFDAGPKPEFQMVNTVKDVLKRVKAGRVKSLGIVVHETDGTFWTGACGASPEDLSTVHLLGMLRFLEEDLIRLAHNEPNPLSQCEDCE